MEDSLKVWSPGRLASGITLPELFAPHSSVLRNKGIAQIFYDIAWIERWGSGIQKIRTACAEAGLPEPVFQKDQDFSVVFRKDIFNEEYLGQQGLNNRQIQAVAYIREHGKITNSEFQILASIKKRQATKDLNDLKERQVISRVGKTGKGTHYILKGAPKGHKGCEVVKKEFPIRFSSCKLLKILTILHSSRGGRELLNYGAIPVSSICRMKRWQKHYVL